MRPLSDLLLPHDSAIPLVREWLAQSPSTCALLPPSAERDRILHSLQVTTRSTMGAVAWETGGLLIQNGWLRVLGSGHPNLARNIVDWNAGRSSGFLLIADDVVGGFFAINGGFLGPEVGEVFYWAPDTLVWESMGVGYSDFLQWACSDKLNLFYSSFRWPGWQQDIANLHSGECFNFFQTLWSGDGSVQVSSRRAITVDEQYRLNLDLAAQLA